MSDEWVRVVVVVDHRRGGRVHAITSNDAEARQITRDLLAKYDGDPLSVTMTVGLVDYPGVAPVPPPG